MKPRKRRANRIVRPKVGLLDGCPYTPSWKMEARTRYMTERLAGAYGPRSPDGIHRATIGADSEPEGDRFKEVGSGN